jgi:hypothetical protein
MFRPIRTVGEDCLVSIFLLCPRGICYYQFTTPMSWPSLALLLGCPLQRFLFQQNQSIPWDANK